MPQNFRVDGSHINSNYTDVSGFCLCWLIKWFHILPFSPSPSISGIFRGCLLWPHSGFTSVKCLPQFYQTLIIFPTQGSCPAEQRPWRSKGAQAEWNPSVNGKGIESAWWILKLSCLQSFNKKLLQWSPTSRLCILNLKPYFKVYKKFKVMFLFNILQVKSVSNWAHISPSGRNLNLVNSVHLQLM